MDCALNTLSNLANIISFISIIFIFEKKNNSVGLDSWKFLKDNWFVWKIIPYLFDTIIATMISKSGGHGIKFKNLHYIETFVVNFGMSGVNLFDTIS